jgi:hypothetical protein
MRKLTKEEFIKECNILYDNFYNYDKINYINNKTKIEVVCPIHESFWVRPDNHKNKKSGCPTCANNQLHTQEQFEYKANKKYDNFYNYSKSVYVNDKTILEIVCPIHGSFYRTPNHHLRGGRCPDCIIEENYKDFISNAIRIHGDKYDYSKVVYKNTRTDVIIICDNCGEFFQKPTIHLMDCGCQKCKRSKGEEKIEKYLKEHNIIYEVQKKFKDCKDKQELPFDFYLPELNTCIEFDGELHFKSYEHFGGDKKLKYYQSHDRMKDEYCKNNNINLFRIRYNEDIEEKLKSFL